MIFDSFIKNLIYDPVSNLGILIFYFLLINLPFSLIALFNKKFIHKQLIIFMTSFFLFCNLCFSLLPHYAPRITYGYSIIFYAIVVLIIEAIVSNTSRKSVEQIEKINPKQDCSCWIMEDDSSTNIQSLDEIPLGHKVAMVNLNKGDTIIKYGHDIGKVVKSIKKGEHVHVHNVKTKKW